MPFLVKMRGQPSSYKQRFSINGILPFWDHFALFWAQKWGSTELQTLDFFLIINNTLMMSKKHIWHLLQFVQGLAKLLLIFTGLLSIIGFSFLSTIWWNKNNHSNTLSNDFTMIKSSLTESYILIVISSTYPRGCQICFKFNPL